jgi:hypothetical protein
MHRLIRILPIIIVACFVLAPSEAEARRRGFALITYGEDVTVLGKISNADALQAMQSELGPGNYEVGYYYSEFGVFWVNFWTWGGEFVVQNGDTVMPVPREVAAQLMGAESVGKPFFYSFPPGFIAILLFAGVWIFSKFKEARAG